MLWFPADYSAIPSSVDVELVMRQHHSMHQLTISHETRISFKIQKSLEKQLGSTSHTTSEFRLAEERWVGLEMYWAVRVTEH